MTVNALEGLTLEQLTQLVADLQPPEWRWLLKDRARASFFHVVRRVPSDEALPQIRHVSWRYEPERQEFIFTADFVGPTLTYNWIVGCDRLDESPRVVNLELEDGFNRFCIELYDEIAREEQGRRARERVTLRMREMWRAPPVYFPDTGELQVDLAAGDDYSTFFTIDRRLLVEGRFPAENMTATQVRAAERELGRQIDRDIQRFTYAGFEIAETNRFYTSWRWEDRNAAEARGLQLLMEWLSPAQLEQYKTYCHFDVTGGSSGKRYRIKHGQVQNVYELDAGDQEICGWCFAPAGGLVPGDVMLAQKVALETNEKGALKVANRFADRRVGTGGWIWLTEIPPRQWVDFDVTSNRIPMADVTVREAEEPAVDPRSWLANWGGMARQLMARPPRDSSLRGARRARR